jgi:magnesium-protoporphyrin IX monomethyl ester (oxidative) cyclase
MLWKFGQVYSAERLLGDHARPVHYEIRLPPPVHGKPSTDELYVHRAQAVG